MRIFAVVLVCASLAGAQESPLSVVAKVERMSDSLVAYANFLLDHNQEPTDSNLKAKVFEMLSSSFTGEALDACKRGVDQGLLKGWALANTDDFDWALPIYPTEFKKREVISNNNQEAVVEYRGQTLETFVLPEDNLPSNVEKLYVSFEVVNPPLDQFLQESNFSGDTFYHVKTDCKMTLRLIKTATGWKISNLQRNMKSKMISEG